MIINRNNSVIPWGKACTENELFWETEQRKRFALSDWSLTHFLFWSPCLMFRQLNLWLIVLGWCQASSFSPPSLTFLQKSPRWRCCLSNHSLNSKALLPTPLLPEQRTAVCLRKARRGWTSETFWKNTRVSVAMVMMLFLAADGSEVLDLPCSAKNPPTHFHPSLLFPFQPARDLQPKYISCCARPPEHTFCQST